MSFSNLGFSTGSMNLTEEMALYMIHSLSSMAGMRGALPRPELSYQLMKECEMMVGQVWAAYNNPIYLPWSIEEYAARLTPQQNIGTDANEEAISRDFPPLFHSSDEARLLLQDVPCTIVDSHGIVVLWYMPGCITHSRHTTFVENMRLLDFKLKQSLPNTSDPQPKKREIGYKLPGTTDISPGHIPFSPCWFDLAHQVVVSRSLKGWPHSPTVKYLKQNKEGLSLLGALLAVIHPRLGVRGFSILRGIQNGAILNAATNSLGPERVLWPSPFSAFSVLSNRATMLHRDGKGVAPFYDIITTLGDYNNGEFQVPAIGLRFNYNPGTVIGACGKVLPHAVPEVNGDRFCIVQYFHKKVLDLITGGGFHDKQEFNGWMRQTDFIANLDDFCKIEN